MYCYTYYIRNKNFIDLLRNDLIVNSINKIIELGIYIFAPICINTNYFYESNVKMQIIYATANSHFAIRGLDSSFCLQNRLVRKIRMI